MEQTHCWFIVCTHTHTCILSYLEHLLISHHTATHTGGHSLSLSLTTHHTRLHSRLLPLCVTTSHTGFSLVEEVPTIPCTTHFHCTVISLTIRLLCFSGCLDTFYTPLCYLSHLCYHLPPCILWRALSLSATTCPPPHLCTQTIGRYHAFHLSPSFLCHTLHYTQGPQYTSHVPIVCWVGVSHCCHIHCLLLHSSLTSPYWATQGTHFLISLWCLLLSLSSCWTPLVVHTPRRCLLSLSCHTFSASRLWNLLPFSVFSLHAQCLLEHL